MSSGDSGEKPVLEKALLPIVMTLSRPSILLSAEQSSNTSFATLMHLAGHAKLLRFTQPEKASLLILSTFSSPSIFVKEESEKQFAGTALQAVGH